MSQSSPSQKKHDGQSARAEAPPAVLLLLAGPAGSGKTTLCERLVAEAPAFSRVVTATTRAPRPGETNGVDYHFLTPGQFDAGLAGGLFLEWAWVHGKHRYGTLAASVLEPLAMGRSLAINIDVQGVESFRNAARKNPLLAERMVTIFIDVPMDELRKRMLLRGQDSGDEIERRMGTAEAEVREAAKFDHVLRSTTRDRDFAALTRVWQAACKRIAAARAGRAVA